MRYSTGNRLLHIDKNFWLYFQRWRADFSKGANSFRTRNIWQNFGGPNTKTPAKVKVRIEISGAQDLLNFSHLLYSQWLKGVCAFCGAHSLMQPFQPLFTSPHASVFICTFVSSCVYVCTFTTSCHHAHLFTSLCLLCSALIGPCRRFAQKSVRTFHTWQPVSLADTHLHHSHRCDTKSFAGGCFAFLQSLSVYRHQP